MDLVTGLVDFVVPSWGKIGWPSEVSSFFMGYCWKITMLHKRYFWIKHILENYLWNYVFLKSVVLWPYYIWLYMKSASCLILHMGKCINIWHRKEKYLWLNSWEWILWIYCIIRKIYGCFDNWESWWKSFWQEMSLKALRSLWISLDIKRLCETTWKWTMFWIHVICELFMFYPCVMTCEYQVII